MALVLYRPVFWILIISVSAVLTWIARNRHLRWWPGWITRFALISVALLGIFSPKGEFITPKIPAREVMIIDFSDSVDPLSREEIQAQAQEWQAQKPGRMIVVFGAQAAVVLNSQGDWPTIDGRSSDIASALRKASDFLGDVPGRVILASDGGITIENAASEIIQELKRNGHRLDVVPLKGRVSAGDIYLGPINAPTSLWENTPFEIVLPVNNAPVDAQSFNLQLVVNEQTVGTEARYLFDNLYAFIIPPQEKGITTIEVIVESQGDPFSENNVSTVVVQIFSSPKVLFVSLTMNQESKFIQSLNGNGIAVDIISPEEIPTDIDALESYQVIFVHNLLAISLSSDKMLALQVYVSQLGRGLIFLGGRNSYTLGNYENTILEPMLPVKLEPPPRPDRPPVLFLLVLDRSLSMSVTKASTPINLAREAAMRAIENLRPEDYLGLLTYQESIRWDIPLRPLGDGLSLRQALDAVGRISVTGGTKIYNALDTAIRAIEKLPPPGPEAKYILLLSDGKSWDGSPEEFQSIAEEARQLGIVITTIALGADADQETMSLIAESAKGRYYPVRDANDLPKIMLAESEAVRSENIQVGLTTLGYGETDHPILSGMSTSRLPMLVAYNALSSKSEEGAEDVLVSTSLGDPILSVWQYGLGRVVAWMADVGEEWAQPWETASDEGLFWSQVVRYALPNPAIGPAQVEVVTNDTNLNINAFIQDLYQNPINLAQATFTYVDKEEIVHRYDLQQVAPGNYWVEIERPPIGAYRAVLAYTDSTDESNTVSVPFAVESPVEWLPTDIRESQTNLTTWAQVTNGRQFTPSELTLDSDIVDQVNPVFVSDWLTYVLLGLVLFWPIEIALRRRWLPWV